VIEMKKTMTSVVSLGTLAVASTLAFASGTADAATPDLAAPTPDTHTMAVPLGPGMQYVGNTEDGSVSLQTPFGMVTTKGAQFQVADAQGRVLAGPENFDVAPKALTTVPSTTPASSAPQQASAAVAPDQAGAAAPVDDSTPAHDPTADFNGALGTAATQFGLATGVGGLIGGVSGAVLGCGLGVATGGSLTAVVSTGTLTPLGALGGCLIGVSTIGTVGTIVGGAALGIPVGIASVVQMYNTLHADGDI
jgi:hypothetical protein